MTISAQEVPLKIKGTGIRRFESYSPYPLILNCSKEVRVFGKSPLTFDGIMKDVIIKRDQLLTLAEEQGLISKDLIASRNIINEQINTADAEQTRASDTAASVTKAFNI